MINFEGGIRGLINDLNGLIEDIESLTEDQDTFLIRSCDDSRVTRFQDAMIDIWEYLQELKNGEHDEEIAESMEETEED